MNLGEVGMSSCGPVSTFAPGGPWVWGFKGTERLRHGGGSGSVPRVLDCSSVLRCPPRTDWETEVWEGPSSWLKVTVRGAELGLGPRCPTRLPADSPRLLLSTVWGQREPLKYPSEKVCWD